MARQFFRRAVRLRPHPREPLRGREGRHRAEPGPQFLRHPRGRPEGARRLPRLRMAVADRPGPVRRAADSERDAVADLDRCAMGPGSLPRPLAEDGAARQTPSAWCRSSPSCGRYWRKPSRWPSRGRFTSSPAGGTPTRTCEPQLMRIIRRAGLVPWPRLFQNLRASRETELAERFPLRVVTDWLGNSPRVAHDHYLSTTEEHFQRRCKIRCSSAAKCGAARNGTGSHRLARLARSPCGLRVYARRCDPELFETR